MSDERWPPRPDIELSDAELDYYRETVCRMVANDVNVAMAKDYAIAQIKGDRA